MPPTDDGRSASSDQSSMPSLRLTGPSRQATATEYDTGQGGGSPMIMYESPPSIDSAMPTLHSNASATSAASTVSRDGESSFRALPNVPQQLIDGVPMIKVTANKIKPREMRLTPTGSAIVWESRKLGIAEICQIREIRLGVALPEHLANQSLTTADAARWITIVYVQPPSQWKVLHMIALSDESFQLWVSTLSGLLDEIKTMAGAAPLENRTSAQIITVTGDKAVRGGQDRAIHWARRVWSAGGLVAADAGLCSRDTTKQLDFDAVVKLCRKAGIGCTLEEVRQIFQSSDRDSKGSLTFAEFQCFVQSLKSRPDVAELYNTVTGGDPMTYECFKSFLQANQGIAPEDPRSLKWFSKYSKLSDGKRIMAEESFAAFLTSPDNSIVPAEDQLVGQDMSRPLHDYYISSSHNTYLVGGQWRGESTVEGYVRALLAGCRTVEIDCWDGDLEPVIYHGKTLTSSVSVRDVCKAIAKYGFLASAYPIIISAEVHCCLEQQDLLARILKQVFGDALVTTALPGRSDVLPSPEELKNRVLIKTKQSPSEYGTLARASTVPIPDYVSLSESTESEVDLTSSRPRSPSIVGRLARRLSSTKRVLTLNIKSSAADSPVVTPTLAPTTAPLPSSQILFSPPIGTQPRPQHRRASSSSLSKPQFSPELMALLVYTSGIKFRGLSKICPYSFNEMFSLGEKTATKLIKTSHEDLTKHNRSHLTRVYPKGTRVTSSNYEPVLFWRVGCQLVAINWQTADIGFKLNFAMFSRNGRCGYVLKPEYLRIRPKDATEFLQKYRLTLEIISGQQLPTSTGSTDTENDPWINTTLYLPPQLSADLASAAPSPPSNTQPKTLSHKTRRIKGNTFNPRWSEKTSFEFSSLPSMIDLIFLDLELRNGDEDTELGRWCGSLGGLQQGYRHIPLYDHLYSQYLYSTLFIRVHLMRGA